MPINSESIMYIIETILFMVAAIGALLIGFEMLSNSITKMFHKQLKKLFDKTSSKAIIGVLIGAAATAIVQSSGATTVMVVGFVNTGIINLFQATSMIMGANIGTTITAQIAALSETLAPITGGTFELDFGALALGLTGVGALVTMFSKKESIKTIGNMLAGFGLLFLGLDCMSLAISNDLKIEFSDATAHLFTQDGIEEIATIVRNEAGEFTHGYFPIVKTTMKGILENEFFSDRYIAPLVLFVLGIVFTAITQSSSLITSLIIAFVSAGIYIGAPEGKEILTNNVLFLILGSNIGSCVTALISSMGASTNAKRASIIHILFNTFGSIIFMVVLYIWKDFMEVTFARWFAGQEGTQIAMFHTFFNITCTIIFLPFIKIFVKIATALVKDKKEKKEEEIGLTYIDERLFGTPSIAVHQVRKELALMYSKAVNILNRAIDGFLNKKVETREEVDKVNEELEAHNKLVIEFMVKLTSQDLVLEDESTISAFHRTLNDILRIGEIAENICKYTKQTVNNNLEFSPNVMLHVGFMKNKINLLYEKTDEVFMTKNLNKLSEADEIEDEIDKMRKEMIQDHMDRLKRNECSPQNSGVYVNLVNNMERAADHMIYIAYSVKEAHDQFKNI